MAIYMDKQGIEKPLVPHFNGGDSNFGSEVLVDYRKMVEVAIIQPTSCFR